MSETCPHCHKNDDRVQCPDCEGTRVVSYCADCDDQIAGDEDILCHVCQEKDDELIEREEFIDALTYPNSTVDDICDRMPEQKPQKILMAI